jgi:hypothetical protein
MPPRRVKQLAHPDITPRAIGHTKAAPLTPLAVDLYIRHKNNNKISHPPMADSTILHFAL